MKIHGRDGGQEGEGGSNGRGWASNRDQGEATRAKMCSGRGRTSTDSSRTRRAQSKTAEGTRPRGTGGASYQELGGQAQARGVLYDGSGIL